MLALIFSLILPVLFGVERATAQGRNKRLPAFAEQILAAHNKMRKSVGVSPLAWSDELQRFAQQWASTLISNGEFSHSRNRQYGQNLFEISDGSATAEDVVSAWAAESKNYDRKSNTCSGTCGHYTQIVWRDTKLLGCAFARNRSREVWVCDYEPYGNIIGQRPY